MTAVSNRSRVNLDVLMRLLTINLRRVSPGDSLSNAGTEQENQADRTHEDQLHGVPDAQQDQEVQPSGPASLDEVPEDGRGQEARDHEEHRGDAPLEAASGADRVEKPVRRHVAAQKTAGVDAEGPDEPEHGGVLLSAALEN